MASLVCLVLYLYLHACSARPLTVSNKGTVNKDVLVVQMDDRKPSTAFLFTDNFVHVGKQAKTSYSWMILLRATGAEIHKRAERSTLESPPCNAEENVSSKDSDSVEDIAVMDYALPHRKPPIHNKGT
ncbi:hypothetical protein CASFOL_008257 [Castilleja foliolosa]|uniref:Uncharacterized protein n=1 Tax=Castilleja foliolosa TaxID=1961234 RepID=A0ABD3E2L7_9LAMI